MKRTNLGIEEIVVVYHVLCGQLVNARNTRNYAMVVLKISTTVKLLTTVVNNQPENVEDVQNSEIVKNQN